MYIRDMSTSDTPQNVIASFRPAYVSAMPQRQMKVGDYWSIDSPWPAS